MSNKLTNPMNLAVIIQYALIHRDQPNGHEPKSLASFFIKSMELKLKSQHQPQRNFICGRLNDGARCHKYRKNISIDKGKYRPRFVPNCWKMIFLMLIFTVVKISHF